MRGGTQNDRMTVVAVVSYIDRTIRDTKSIKGYAQRYRNRLLIPSRIIKL